MRCNGMLSKRERILLFYNKFFSRSQQQQKYFCINQTVVLLKIESLLSFSFCFCEFDRWTRILRVAVSLCLCSLKMCKDVRQTSQYDPVAQASAYGIRLDNHGFILIIFLFWKCQFCVAQNRSIALRMYLHSAFVRSESLSESIIKCSRFYCPANSKVK